MFQQESSDSDSEWIDARLFHISECEQNSMPSNETEKKVNSKPSNNKNTEYTPYYRYNKRLDHYVSYRPFFDNTRGRPNNNLKPSTKKRKEKNDSHPVFTEWDNYRNFYHNLSWDDLKRKILFYPLSNIHLTQLMSKGKIDEIAKRCGIKCIKGIRKDKIAKEIIDFILKDQDNATIEKYWKSITKRRMIKSPDWEDFSHSTKWKEAQRQDILNKLLV
jgi:hypothetical protein